MHATVNFTPFSPSTNLFNELNIILNCRISLKMSSFICQALHALQTGRWNLSIKEMKFSITLFLLDKGLLHREPCLHLQIEREEKK